MDNMDLLNLEIKKYYCKLIFVDNKYRLVNFVPPKTVNVIHVYPSSMPTLKLVRRHIIKFEKEGKLETP